MVHKHFWIYLEVGALYWKALREALMLWMAMSALRDSIKEQVWHKWNSISNTIYSHLVWWHALLETCTQDKIQDAEFLFMIYTLSFHIKWEKKVNENFHWSNAELMVTFYNQLISSQKDLFSKYLSN